LFINITSLTTSRGVTAAPAWIPAGRIATALFVSTQNKLFVEDLNLSGKRVIVRVDFNVPLKDGVVESDKRLKESLPTIKYLREKSAKVILMSHLGRPDGKRVADMSLRPVADALAALLGAPVAFAHDCLGAPAE